MSKSTPYIEAKNGFRRSTVARVWSAAFTERWRSMTIGERAQITEQLSVDVTELALTDIRARHPAFTENEVLHELARRRYGSELADAAYGSLLGR